MWCINLVMYAHGEQFMQGGVGRCTECYGYYQVGRLTCIDKTCSNNIMTFKNVVIHAMLHDDDDDVVADLFNALL